MNYHDQISRNIDLDPVIFLIYKQAMVEDCFFL